MSSQPQESTLTLSPAGKEDPTALRKTYEDVLAATRGLSLKFPRGDISKALLLIEIEDLAQNELDKIGEDIGKNVKPWNLEFYHREVLLKPSWTADPDTPDAFFSRYAGTKPRLILRLAGKVILHKVRSLLLSAPGLVLELISTFDVLVPHEQIKGYIERWDKNIESEVAERARRQALKLGKSQKRQRESKTDQTAASKRQLTTELLGQEILRQPQILSAAYPSNTRNSPQRGIINHAQALPTITSLHPELPNFQSHRNLPSPPKTRQVTTQTDNLTHDHAFHAGLAPYYQNQQILQNSTLQTPEEHQRLGLQMQQEQEQELLDEVIEHQWVFDSFGHYQF